MNRRIFLSWQSDVSINRRELTVALEQAVIEVNTSKLSQEYVKLVYCLTSFLWKQNYTYLIVIDIFTKNLSHVDWRIRLITNECLRTWKREYDLIDLNVSKPRILDRVKAKMNKNYEVKLIG